jgi:L-seryl-tRNA(Ser) seleniumtransferase
MNRGHTLQRRLAGLPAVHTVLNHPAIRDLCGRHPRRRVVDAVRDALREIRAGLLEYPDQPASPQACDLDALARRVAGRLSEEPPGSFRPVINASGILFHPAAGHAPLSPAARRAAAETLLPAAHACEQSVRHLLRRLTGAEDALAVHSPQAAFWLAVESLGRGKEAVIARAHLGTGEDGGRLLDVLRRCGVQVVEVGATNKARLSDFRAAIGSRTGLLCAIRPATYALRGFTQEVPIEDLGRLGRETGIPVLYDIGHAPLTPMVLPDWRSDTSAAEAAGAGVAVTVVRGDGLAGGPPCGLALGHHAALEAMRQNPLHPMVNPSLPTFAALEATLQVYARAEDGLAYPPAARMLMDPPDAVYDRARRLLERCQGVLSPHGAVEIREHAACLTRSRLPSETFPSYAVAFRPASRPPDLIADRLYRHTPALLAATEPAHLLLDLRTVEEEQVDGIGQILERVFEDFSP